MELFRSKRNRKLKYLKGRNLLRRISKLGMHFTRENMESGFENSEAYELNDGTPSKQFTSNLMHRSWAAISEQVNESSDEGKSSLVHKNSELESLRKKTRELSKRVLEMAKEIDKLEKENKQKEEIIKGLSQRQGDLVTEDKVQLDQMEKMTVGLSEKDQMIQMLQRELESTKNNGKTSKRGEEPTKEMTRLKRKEDLSRGESKEETQRAKNINGLLRQMNEKASFDDQVIETLRREKEILEESLKLETLENEKLSNINKILRELSENGLSYLNVPKAFEKNGRVDLVFYVKTVESALRNSENQNKSKGIKIESQIQRINSLETTNSQLKESIGRREKDLKNEKKKLEQLEESYFLISSEKVSALSQLTKAKLELSSALNSQANIEAQLQHERSQSNKVQAFFCEKTEWLLGVLKKMASFSLGDMNELPNFLRRILQELINKLSFDLIHFQDLLNAEEEAQNASIKKEEEISLLLNPPELNLSSK